MSSYKQPTMLCMVDIESLDVGPRSIVSQIGVLFARADDPETSVKEILVYLPIQPQIALKRTLSAQTLVWWMKQSDEARAEFEANTGDDFEELPSLLRHVIRQYNQVVGDESCEVWARGPQFDIVNVESLMADCALAAPWAYSTVRDLRTLMALAGLRTQDIPRPVELTDHMALMDCKYQLLCYTEAMKHLRSRS